MQVTLSEEDARLIAKYVADGCCEWLKEKWR